MCYDNTKRVATVRVACIRHHWKQKSWSILEIRPKMPKIGEVGDRNLDLPQSARCKADALPLSYIPSDHLIDEKEAVTFIIKYFSTLLSLQQYACKKSNFARQITTLDSVELFSNNSVQRIMIPNDVSQGATI